VTAPNLLNLSTITAKTVGVGIETTSTVGILTNSASSNKVLKINHLRVTNNSNGSSSSFNVFYQDTNNVVTGIASNFTIPSGSSIVVIDKDSTTYVEENCSIRVSVANTARMTVLVSYEELS
jgi:hypothetical protein